MFYWMDSKTVQYVLDAIERIEKRQVNIQSALNVIQNTLNRMEIQMAAIDDALAAAEAAAKANEDAEDAVMTLLGTLSQQILALGQGTTDPNVTARVQALADGLNAKKDALAAAIVANTPAA